MTASAHDLLSALLTIYWRGGVSQTRAAQLVGLRKETFAELADLRLGEAALQRVAMRHCRAAFHRLFPECDPQARLQGTRARTPPAMPSDWSPPTVRDCHLVTPPQRRTLWELVPSPRRTDAEVAAYLKRNPVPLCVRFIDDDETGTENEVAEVKYG